MDGFPEGHDRLCALEWLLQRLAVDHCMSKVAPVTAAEELFEAGEAYGMAMIRAASGNTDHIMTALSISTAIKMLLEPIVDEVKATK